MMKIQRLPDNPVALTPTACFPIHSATTETTFLGTGALLLVPTNSVATGLCRETKRYDEDPAVALTIQLH